MISTRRRFPPALSKEFDELYVHVTRSNGFKGMDEIERREYTQLLDDLNDGKTQRETILKVQKDNRAAQADIA